MTRRFEGRVRRAVQSDLPFMRRMLYEAAYWRPEGHRPSIEEGLKHPDLKKLLAAWGREGDSAVIATDTRSAGLTLTVCLRGIK